MNAGKYGRSSAALKELLALDPLNTEARRLFATLHLRLGSLMTARTAFESLAEEALQRQDYWLAESLLREYLAVGPRCVPFLEQLAKVYEEKGDSMAAVAELGKAIDVLLEDPDPERPGRPSELYARIRSLAPASPIAFRLAHLFNPDTGELVAPRPAPAAAADTGPSAESGDTGDRAQIATGPMPWEDIVETNLPSGLPVGTEADQASSDPAGDSVNGAEQETNVESSTVEADPGQTETSITGNLSEPVPQNLLGGERPSFEAQNETSAALEPPPAPRICVDPSGSDTDVEPPTLVPSADVHATPPPAVSPMPWDQVEEVPIPIPETEPGSSPASSAWSSAAFKSPETPDPSSDSSTASVPADQRDQETPASESSTTSRSPTSEQPKQEKSAWDNIFYKAWSLTAGLAECTAASAPVISDGPEPASHEPPAEPESTSSSANDSAPMAEVRFTDSGRIVVPPPIAAPMPWEDVQETPIAIPVPEAVAAVPTAEPADGAAAGDDAPQEPALESASSIACEAEHAEEPAAEPPTHALAPVPDTVEHVPATPDPEPEFRYASPVLPASNTPAEEPQPAVEEASVDMEGPVEASATISTECASSITAQPAFSDAAEPAPLALQAEPFEAAGLAPDSEVPASIHQHEYAVPPLGPEEPDLARSNWRQSPPAPAETESRSEADPSSAEARSVQEETDSISLGPGDSGQTKPSWVEELSRGITQALSPGWMPPSSEKHDRTEAWLRTGEQQVPEQTSEPAAPWGQSPAQETPSRDAAAAAVGVLFDSASRSRSQEIPLGRSGHAKPRRRLSSSLSRARQHILFFIGSCFSTTRSLVSLCVGAALFATAVTAVGVGVLGLTWLVLEERPNAAFHNLNVTPQRAMTDPKRNGYLLLMGFGAPAERDPVQYGYERRATDSDWDAAKACVGQAGEAAEPGRAEASASVLHRWFGSVDPTAKFSTESATLRGWGTQQAEELARYRQWLRMPFEDWGYGQQVSPDCAKILFAHRLYVAEGLGQDLGLGLDRLETDMEAWRNVLAQAKTLPVKMMAREAVTDDVAVASGLLARPELDDRHVGRLMKLARPLDQVESSIRWPMQSHFIWATKSIDAVLKHDDGEDRPFYASLATALSLPKQRRFNRYAEYYEAASRAGVEGRMSSFPKRSTYVRTPPAGLVDYVMNPIENIVGLEPLPDWDTYSGRMVETDARLRLASLQGWVRSGHEGSLLTRMAKAGQKYYDPFTGFPMLVNAEKGLMYSVGRDGKDHEADPQRDLVVVIPPEGLSKHPAR